MRSKRKAATLRRIGEIRGLQRLAAEAEAMRGASMLRERDDARAAAGKQRDGTEEHWRAALQLSSLAVEVVAQWSDALRREERLVREAETDRDDAAVALDRLRLDWKGAVMREDLARTAASGAARALRRQRDEAALQDAADRVTARRCAR